MKRLAGVDAPLPPGMDALVCTVGVFDGVHRGHRQLLYELRRWSESISGQACVLTFDRHPVTVLRGVNVPAILSLENRLHELERHGVDVAWVLDFESVRDLTPEAFFREVLLGRLGCHHLLLGFDARLGREGAGDTHNLPPLGASLGIEVRVAPPVFDKDGGKISSSAIREAIGEGDLSRAANLLGRPFSIRGVIQRGAGVGRGLGTATANLELEGQIAPPDGVYLVRVFAGERTAPAIANLGVRPTFGEGGERRLEVHVPGWSGDLYGSTLEVRLIRRVRDERKFESPNALREQIARDLNLLAQAVAKGEI